MKTKNSKGFTLPELLVVVAVLALIGTLALSLTDGVEEQATEKVTIANQGALLKSFHTYVTMNKGKLNNLDSLLRVDVPAATGTGSQIVFVDSDQANTKGNGLYTGCTQIADQALAPDDADAIKKAQDCKGLYNDSGSTSQYAIYYAGQRGFSPIYGLKKLGLTNVYDHSYGYGHPVAFSSRGSETYTSNFISAENLKNNGSYEGPTFRADASANWKRELTGGHPILIINPKNASMYKRFGVDIETLSKDADETACLDALNKAEYVLGVFGIGNKCTAVGGRGGINSAPKCGILGKAYYPFYILVVKISLSPDDLGAAKVVGVLDSKGRTVEDVQFSDTWRYGD